MKFSETSDLELRQGLRAVILRAIEVGLYVHQTRASLQRCGSSVLFESIVEALAGIYCDLAKAEAMMAGRLAAEGAIIYVASRPEGSRLDIPSISARKSMYLRVFKRLFDLAATLVALLTIAPLLLLVAVIVKLQDGGPILNKQVRIGPDGNEFAMYKFRTMVLDVEGVKNRLLAEPAGTGGLFRLHNDPRITPFGRFLRDYSLDELPQLFNVLRGDMSLVGPRPLLHQTFLMLPSRLRVTGIRPGLTSIAVIRRANVADEYSELLAYRDAASLLTDVRIMLRTMRVVFTKERVIG